ncbi:TPR-like protein [Lichtheimia hyalospora FSU 10163]|nr:TPR-like protein [Lichtheimia hyalospora FSU 10163]
MNSNQDDCSHGALSKVWKHLNVNRELHQASSGESSQKAAIKPFRSVSQHPSTLQDDKIFNEFFVPSQNEYRPLTNPLGSNLPFTMDIPPPPPPPPQMKAPDSWVGEFNSRHDGNEQQLQDAWYNHATPVTPFEHAYAQHFTNPQNTTTDMNHVMDAQWERQFAAISIDTPSMKSPLHSSIREHMTPFITQQPLSTSSRTSFTAEIATSTINTTSTPDEDFDDWIDENDLFTQTRHGARYNPDLGEYTFIPENPYLKDKDTIDMSENDIQRSSETILALEATILQDPDNSSHAWMQLAMIHVQNDNHKSAVQALKNTKHDPQHTMMQLALCYSSLDLYPAAYDALEQWISQAYPNLMSTNTQQPMEPFMLHRRVMDSFLSAARSNPEADAMDPDVQVGLAILSAGSAEYHKAADCFRAALHMRPKDAILWNRLAITLANDGKPEEAIDAYSHALELDPSYVSARHHLSISCITIGCYKEAVEHVLSALALYSRQSFKDDMTAKPLWETLERALKMMGMHDLARQAKIGTDIKMFQAMFE